MENDIITHNLNLEYEKKLKLTETLKADFLVKLMKKTTLLSKEIDVLHERELKLVSV